MGKYVCKKRWEKIFISLNLLYLFNNKYNLMKREGLVTNQSKTLFALIRGGEKDKASFLATDAFNSMRLNFVNIILLLWHCVSAVRSPTNNRNCFVHIPNRWKKGFKKLLKTSKKLYNSAKFRKIICSCKISKRHKWKLCPQLKKANTPIVAPGNGGKYVFCNKCALAMKPNSSSSLFTHCSRYGKARPAAAKSAHKRLEREFD